MQESYRLNIPLLTEAKYGLNWDEMQDLDLEAK
jgi:hypothetical protein